MKMRFRTDGWHYADLKAEGKSLEQYCAPEAPTEEERRRWDATPKAERGDVWRVFWRHCDESGNHLDDRIAGYAICCISCGRVHHWTTALNCGQKFKTDWGESCIHQRDHGSCWQWSGSAEAGTLTARPSICVVKDRCRWGCAFHGWLTNGEIKSC
jgi:hypothetical protein